MSENRIRYLFGDKDTKVCPQKPFHAGLCEFLDALSKEIRADGEARNYPDIMTFAFWIRRANVMKMKEAYETEVRMGKGLVFHIAPSNVPINFAYTMVFGMLSGNSNIVKASSKDFAQTKIICRIMSKLAEQEEFQWVREQNAVVMYERECAEFTERFSSECNARVVWGGDKTIQEVRKAPIPARTTEITFADRYSFAYLGAKAVLAADEVAMDRLTSAFYNDTYLMDQNACTAPHLICWRGEDGEIEKASDRFWKCVYEKVRSDYLLEDIKVSDKYTILCEQAAKGFVSGIKKYENYLYVAKVSRLPENIGELRGRFGLFFEYHMKGLCDLASCIDERVQTCAVYGVEKEMVCKWIAEQHVKGIDRIVEVGQTLDIGLVWDGYDIVRTLSRSIVI